MDPDSQPVTEAVPGITVEEHLTIVRIGGDLRGRLLATLEGAGWRFVTDDDLPSPDPDLLDQQTVEDHEREMTLAAQAAAAADADLAEALDAMTTVSAELDRSERRRAELEGLADLVSAELAEARHVEDSTERLTRIVDAASGLGFDRTAPALAAWVDQITAGAAAPDPDATALVQRRGQIEAELASGAGSVDQSPAVLAAHQRRHELRSLAVELEGMVERGLTPESRQLIEAANAKRVQAEDSGRRGAGAARDALAAEEEILARFGYASFPDYQISSSTRSVGEHAEATLVEVRRDIDAADAALVAAQAAAEQANVDLTAELARLDDAVRALAGDRSIEGIVARPPAIAELCDLVAGAIESERAVGEGHRERLAELGTSVDRLTQESARAEGEVESMTAAHAELTAAWEAVAVAALEAEDELRDRLASWVAEGPVALQAELAWLPATRLVELLDAAAENGPIVWCTDRTDLPGSRAFDGPTRWWQFRRRARQSVLSS